MSIDDAENGSGGGGGGHDAGGMLRWLLTYADMITLLMAFFIMMYSMSVISLDKFDAAASSLRAEFGPSVDNARRSRGAGLLPGVGDGAGPVLAPLEEDIQAVVDQLEEYVADRDLADLVTTRQEQRGLVISVVSDNLLFPVGQAELRAPALSILDEIAGLLKELPNDIVVEGHTCNLPIRTALYPSNWELSAARACRVVRYLAERKGVPATRLAATGHGDSRPVSSNDTEESRVRNRRVDMVIVAGVNHDSSLTTREPDR